MTADRSTSKTVEPLLRRVPAWAESLIANPFFAYAAVVLVQLKVIWDYWVDKDLNPGDTSAYFLDAAGWAHGLHENLSFSPLYDAYFGSILAAVRNVYAAAMIHRILIVLLATVLVLALARALLGPALGLLVALWWAVIPTNFNALYEIHLFGVLPILVVVLVVARHPTRTGRGIALATLLGATILLRNELLIAVLAFAALIALYELRVRDTEGAGTRRYLRSYGIPLAVVLVLTGGAYWRSHVQGSDLRAVFAEKSKLALCTAYAANYGQRHPSRFSGNPFIDCQPVMQQVFGRSLPSVRQAVVANPHEFALFAGWNAREVPSAIALGLFAATPGANNPGYSNVTLRSGYALALSLLVGAVLLAGVAVGWRDREFWLRQWLPPRRWAVAALASVVAGNLFVVVFTERPWTEYTFTLTVGALLCVGLSVAVLLRRVMTPQVLALVTVAVTVVLAATVPPYYHRGPRPLHDAVHRLHGLHSFRKALEQPGTTLVVPTLGQATCFYLARTYDRFCHGVDWAALRAQVTPSKPAARVLSAARVSVLYADATMVADPTLAGLLAAPRVHGWRQVASGSGREGPWRILTRVVGAR